jgi:hypothetical protein
LAAHDDLLRSARSQLDRQASTTELKRAVSTAYYAVFHCLIESAVVIIFNDASCQKEARSWFDHKALASVASSLSKAPTGGEPELAKRPDYYNQLRSWLDQSGTKLGFVSVPTDEEIEIGRGLFQLYEKRQMADYFTPWDLKLTQARTLVARADDVCKKIEFCVQTRSPGFACAVTHMLWESLGKRPRS